MQYLIRGAGLETMSEATIPAQAATPRASEDVVALGLGLAVFALALVSLLGPDTPGWRVKTSVWSAGANSR